MPYTQHLTHSALTGRRYGSFGGKIGTVVETPVAAVQGGGKPRRRRYQVEIDGEVFDVESQADAEALLELARKEAERLAEVAIERATKRLKTPARKVMADARKALPVPVVSVPPDMRAMADAILAQIRETYRSTLHTIEIAALMRDRERAIEEDDEEVLMLL